MDELSCHGLAYTRVPGATGVGDVCSPQIVTLLVTGSLDVAEFLPWKLVAAARGHPPAPHPDLPGVGFLDDMARLTHFLSFYSHPLAKSASDPAWPRAC